MPMFYLGSTSLSNIKNGYIGSVSSKMFRDIWLKEKQDSKELFKVYVISEHTTREAAYDKETSLQIKRNCIHSSMYINRSIANKKFSNAGTTLTKEHCAKISAKLTGRIVSQKTKDLQSRQRCGGSHAPHSKATILKMRLAKLGKLRSEETKQKLKKPKENAAVINSIWGKLSKNPLILDNFGDYKSFATFVKHWILDGNVRFRLTKMFCVTEDPLKTALKMCKIMNW
jgi:hypothetical protein